MTLDLLIPQYKETNEIVKPLLDSLALQQNVDFNNVGVIIVNDGSDVFLSENLLNSYPFKITYYKNNHEGVSAARQKACDLSQADYVMFCDADDLFYNLCGLWIIFREISSEPDCLSSIFIEEYVNSEGKIDYVNRERDTTFVHGKVYKRQYLIENNIRWNPKLTIHEDSYFNCLAQRLTSKAKYYNNSFYLWKWRRDSVCRSDPKYMLKTYPNYLESNTALINEFLGRGMEIYASAFVTSMIYETYLTLNKNEWLASENKEYRDKTELCFSQYYNTFKEFFLKESYAQKVSILQTLKERFYKEGLLVEKITFDDWIRYIESLIQK